MLFSHLPARPGRPPPPTGAPTFLPGRPERPSRKATAPGPPSALRRAERAGPSAGPLRPNCAQATQAGPVHTTGYTAMTGLRPGMRQVSKELFLFQTEGPFLRDLGFGFRMQRLSPRWTQSSRSTEAVTPPPPKIFQKASGRHFTPPKDDPDHARSFPSVFPPLDSSEPFKQEFERRINWRNSDLEQ